jgi:hypothetical protein
MSLTWYNLEAYLDRYANTTLPESLGNLTELRNFLFWGIGVHGKIPKQLFALTNLLELYVNQQKRRKKTSKNRISLIFSLSRLDMVLPIIYTEKFLPKLLILHR